MLYVARLCSLSEEFNVEAETCLRIFYLHVRCNTIFRFNFQRV